MKHSLIAAAAWMMLIGASAAQPPISPPPPETPELLVPPRQPLPPPPPPLRGDPPLVSPPVIMVPGDSVFMRRSIGGPPGWFFDLDLALLFPEVRTRGPDDGLFGTSTDFGLDANLAATITLGYTFVNENAILFSYRGFGTDGRPEEDDSAFFTNVRTQLDINDLVWSYRHMFKLPYDRLRISGDAGIRLTTIYQGVKIHSDFPSFIVTPAVAGFEIDVCASNNFIGAGPTVGLASDFELMPGISLFSRTDFAALFGEQEFKVRTRSTFPGGSPTSSHTSEHNSNTVKVLRWMTGVNWAPCRTPRMSFQLGYQFEYWWDISKIDDIHDDLMLNGLFAQMRFRY